MRLAQLYEAQTPVSYDSLADRIRAECSDVLELYLRTSSVFMRGDKVGGADAFKSDIRPTRTPVQMQPTQHEAIKKAFEILELPVTRDNAIFCSADREITEPWGDTYIIFPTNGWKGLIFKDVKEGYVFQYLKLKILPSARYDHDKYKIEKIADGLKDLHPQLFSANDADSVLKEGFQDILITGRSYYGVTVHSEKTNDLLKQLGFPMDSTRLNNVTLP